ncbi:unnamed protein product [Cuscuta campestris]|uniref:Trichome birefringence-like C-terminal domain-containing protein n=1 Tax=Cuscuta campestris TaxID=132261 RepID=A0A484KKA4_9ASTE|nr:unnamed protein product [Cuscuta campestris]
MLDRTVYLVDVVREEKGRILKLDSIEGGKIWSGIDMLIFNTWHWWNRRGISQPWDYIKVGDHYYRDMDRMVAFEKALNTWANWVDENINPSKTMYMLAGSGTDWDEPGAKSCIGQKEPLSGSKYPGALPPALTVLKKIAVPEMASVHLSELLDLGVGMVVAAIGSMGWSSRCVELILLVVLVFLPLTIFHWLAPSSFCSAFLLLPEFAFPGIIRSLSPILRCTELGKAPEVLQVVSEPRSRVRFPAGAIAEGEIVGHVCSNYPVVEAMWAKSQSNVVGACVLNAL